MDRKRFKKLRINTKQITLATVIATLHFLLSSCMFTGIENTGRIKLSKEDVEAANTVSEEDKLMAPLSDCKISEWRQDKPFYGASDRVRFIFTSAPDDPYGKTLFYSGCEKTSTPLGKEALNIMFRDSLDRVYIFQKETRADAEIGTADLPLLVDLDMVAKADSILSGRTLWSKSRLWESPDNLHNSIAGTKFTPVKVEKVIAGDADFPLRVLFTNPDGVAGSLVFNPSPKSSRSFSSQFSISDPRLSYKKITDDKWKDICHGRLSFGMTKQEARLSYGAPDEIESGHDYSKLIENWYYSNGAFLRFEDGLLVSFRK